MQMGFRVLLLVLMAFFLELREEGYHLDLQSSPCCPQGPAQHTRMWVSADRGLFKNLLLLLPLSCIRREADILEVKVEGLSCKKPTVSSCFIIFVFSPGRSPMTTGHRESSREHEVLCFP